MLIIVLLHYCTLHSFRKSLQVPSAHNQKLVYKAISLMHTLCLKASSDVATPCVTYKTIGKISPHCSFPFPGKKIIRREPKLHRIASDTHFKMLLVLLPWVEKYLFASVRNVNCTRIYLEHQVNWRCRTFYYLYSWKSSL